MNMPSRVSISTVVCLVIAASTSSHSVRNPSYPSYPDPRDFYSSGNDASSPFEQSSPTDEPLEEYHEPENNGGWQGWRGIPIPLHPTSRYHNRNVHKEIVTTSRPVVKDLYYPTEDHTSDQWTKEVPTQQSRYGWQPKKYIPVHLARQRVIVKPTRRYHSTRAPEKLSTNGHQMSAHLQQPSDFGQKPTSLDERPFYEPSQFWNPGNQGMDILVNDPPGNRDEGEGRDMEELSDDQPQPLPPLRQPARDHHQPRMIQEGRGRELRGSESRAQGVIVTGKDLEAEAGHHSGGHHGFFQYVRVPHKGAWEFGYRRGNHGHFTERHEQGHGHHFKTKVRWGDKHGGYGEHYWDYNHHGKPDHYDHHDDGHHGKHHHKFAAASSQDQVTSSDYDSHSPSSSPSPSPRSPF